MPFFPLELVGDHSVFWHTSRAGLSRAFQKGWSPKIADIMFPGKYQSDFAVQVTSQIPDAQQFTKDGVLQPQKSAFKLFVFFANSEYFEEDYHIIEVQGTAITVLTQDINDYISLTDIAKYKEPNRSDHVIQNWMRNRNTIEFLGIWERLNNVVFKPLEFEGFKNRAGLNSFVLTPRQWIDATNAIGLVSKSGRYGGTYAHKDIAFEFASWISVEFKLYLIKEFQRLKEDENNRLSLAWDLNRTLSKLNYHIHTDAIKAHLIPAAVTPSQAAITYANEADLLNVALFGQTAKQWRDTNPKLEGNMREYATVEQLLVLANIEAMNAELIHMSLSQGERLKRLNQIAIRQMEVLTVNTTIKKLKE